MRATTLISGGTLSSAKVTYKTASRPPPVVISPNGNDESRDLMYSPLVDLEKELTEVSESDIDFMNDAEFCVEPLDGSDPNVYSLVKGSSPFSFLHEDEWIEASPPPTYL